MLYIPEYIRVKQVNDACYEYDSRLYFAFNETDNQYCIFIKMPHGTAPRPLLGFDEIPHPEDAIKRLYKADTLRFGEEIYDKLLRNNEAIKKASEDKASDGTGDAAERIEHELRER